MAVHPPSSIRLLPVSIAAAGDAANTTAAATSSGVPNRPMGDLLEQLRADFWIIELCGRHLRADERWRDRDDADAVAARPRPRAPW